MKASRIILLLVLCITMVSTTVCFAKDTRHTGNDLITKVEAAKYTNEVNEYIKNNKNTVGVKNLETKDGSFIIITGGQKPTGGYYFELEAVNDGRDYVSVDVSFISPRKGQIVNQLVTYPVLVLKRNTEKEIRVMVLDSKNNREKEYVLPIAQCRDYPKDVQKFIDSRKGNVGIYTVRVSDKVYIVVLGGEQPTGGYSIVLNKYFKGGRYNFVDLLLKGPAKGQMVTQALTYPYIVFEKDVFGKSVLFLRQDRSDIIAARVID